MTPEEGKKILEELHEGICSARTEGRILAVMAIQTGYDWPNLREDAMTLVWTCDKCQKFAPIQQVPSTPMTPIVNHLPICGDRLLHQVDRGRGRCLHNLSRSAEVHLEEHHHSFRHSPRHHL